MPEADGGSYPKYTQAKYTAHVFQGLGSPVRVRLIEELADGRERTVTELVQRIGLEHLTPGNVSSHLGILYQHGLVNWRRQGNRSYYRLHLPRVARLCELAAKLTRMPGS
jgi:DNA-binding transcriptional ArsR family regulator